MCKDEGVLLKVQEFIKTRNVVGFDWENFLEFLREETNEAIQTVEVKMRLLPLSNILC